MLKKKMYTVINCFLQIYFASLYMLNVTIWLIIKTGKILGNSFLVRETLTSL